MSPIHDKQIKAMITLLAGEDEQTVDLVKKSLIGLGEGAVPSLLRAAEMGNTDVHKSLQTILGEIRFTRCEADFRQWADSATHDPDLEEGAFLLAKFRYPTLDIQYYRRKLDDMASALKETLDQRKHPRTIIGKINHYFYSKEQFKGNTEDYYNPENSYIHCVLDQKKGIPISLSLVYLLVAKRLGLPVSGVGLPGYFILKYEAAGYTAYIDAFNQGQSLSRKDCMRFLSHSGHNADKAYLSATSHREIILRMIRNLVYVYHQTKAQRRVERLIRLSQAISVSG